MVSFIFLLLGWSKQSDGNLRSTSEYFDETCSLEEHPNGIEAEISLSKFFSIFLSEHKQIIFNGYQLSRPPKASHTISLMNISHRFEMAGFIHEYHQTQQMLALALIDGRKMVQAKEIIAKCSGYYISLAHQASALKRNSSSNPGSQSEPRKHQRASQVSKPDSLCFDENNFIQHLFEKKDQSWTTPYVIMALKMEYLRVALIENYDFSSKVTNLNNVVKMAYSASPLSSETVEEKLALKPGDNLTQHLLKISSYLVQITCFLITREEKNYFYNSLLFALEFLLENLGSFLGDHFPFVVQALVDSYPNINKLPESPFEKESLFKTILFKFDELFEMVERVLPKLPRSILITIHNQITALNVFSPQNERGFSLRYILLRLLKSVQQLIVSDLPLNLETFESLVQSLIAYENNTQEALEEAKQPTESQSSKRQNREEGSGGSEEARNKERDSKGSEKKHSKTYLFEERRKRKFRNEISKFWEFYKSSYMVNVQPERLMPLLEKINNKIMKVFTDLYVLMAENQRNIETGMTKEKKELGEKELFELQNEKFLGKPDRPDIHHSNFMKNNLEAANKLKFHYFQKHSSKLNELEVYLDILHTVGTAMQQRCSLNDLSLDDESLLVQSAVPTPREPPMPGVKVEAGSSPIEGESAPLCQRKKMEEEEAENEDQNLEIQKQFLNVFSKMGILPSFSGFSKENISVLKQSLRILENLLEFFFNDQIFTDFFQTVWIIYSSFCSTLSSVFSSSKASFVLKLIGKMSEFLRVSSPNLHFLTIIKVILASLSQTPNPTPRLDAFDASSAKAEPDFKKELLEVLVIYSQKVPCQTFDEVFLVLSQLLELTSRHWSQEHLSCVISCLLDNFTVKSKAWQETKDLFVHLVVASSSIGESQKQLLNIFEILFFDEMVLKAAKIKVKVNDIMNTTKVSQYHPIRRRKDHQVFIHEMEEHCESICSRLELLVQFFEKSSHLVFAEIIKFLGSFENLKKLAMFFQLYIGSPSDGVQILVLTIIEHLLRKASLIPGLEREKSRLILSNCLIFASIIQHTVIDIAVKNSNPMMPLKQTILLEIIGNMFTVVMPAIRPNSILFKGSESEETKGEKATKEKRGIPEMGFNIPDEFGIEVTIPSEVDCN